MRKAIEESQRKARATGDDNAARAAASWEKKKVQRIGLHRSDGKHYKLYSLEKMQEKWLRQSESVEAIQADARLRFKFPCLNPAPSAGEEFIVMQDASFAYGQGLTEAGALLRNVSLAVHGRTQAAVVGQMAWGSQHC